MKIMIDAGHGGKKLGAVGLNGTQEKDINLAMAFVLGGVLLKRGYDVSFTRLSDIDMSLSNRVSIANEFKPDLFISLHCNANENRTVKGMEVYTSIGCTKSDRYAHDVHTAMLNFFTDHKDFAGKGTSEENFYILKKTNMSAILIESEFISHPEMEDFLNENYIKIAEVIGSSINEIK